MQLSEKDLKKIKEMKKRYKFLKGIELSEIADLFLSRCEHCGELFFEDDLVPIKNWKGKIYEVCENCSYELIETEADKENEIIESKNDDIRAGVM